MNIEPYTKEHVENWIKNKTKSTNKLLFLDSTIYQPGNEAKEKLFLQYIDALANQGSGSIVMGIKTFKQRAKEIGKNIFNSKDVFTIKTLIETRISPSIENLSVYTINTDSDKTVLVITLCESNMPYMIDNEGYYGWNGLKTRKLTENEIRHLYLNHNKPQLEYVGVINTQGIGLLENGLTHTIQFYPKFFIRNAGNMPEKEYKVEFWFPSSIVDTTFSPIQDYFQRLEGPYSVYSIPSRTTLFQDETFTIAEAKLMVTNDNMNDFLNLDFQIHIYYSHGKLSHSFKLNETFNYQKKQITQNSLKAIF